MTKTAQRNKPKHGLKAGTIVEVGRGGTANAYLGKVKRWTAVMGDPANLPRYGTHEEYVPVQEIYVREDGSDYRKGGLLIPKTDLRVVGNTP